MASQGVQDAAGAAPFVYVQLDSFAGPVRVTMADVTDGFGLRTKIGTLFGLTVPETALLIMRRASRTILSAPREGFAAIFDAAGPDADIRPLTTFPDPDLDFVSGSCVVGRLMPVPGGWILMVSFPCVGL
jgi:hypothetical protein